MYWSQKSFHWHRSKHWQASRLSLRTSRLRCIIAEPISLFLTVVFQTVVQVSSHLSQDNCQNWSNRIIYAFINRRVLKGFIKCPRLESHFQSCKAGIGSKTFRPSIKMTENDFVLKFQQNMFRVEREIQIIQITLVHIHIIRPRRAQCVTSNRLSIQMHFNLSGFSGSLS